MSSLLSIVMWMNMLLLICFRMCDCVLLVMFEVILMLWLIGFGCIIR